MKKDKKLEWESFFQSLGLVACILAFSTILIIGIPWLMVLFHGEDTTTEQQYTQNLISIQPHQQTQTILHQTTLQHVIDGDTIIIYSGERVRLIGVDAPEMGFGSSQYEIGATEATEFVRSLVSVGQVIWLESQGSDRDRFGRLRRYVWLEIPTDINDPDQRRTLTINGLLLEYGYATVWP